MRDRLLRVSVSTAAIAAFIFLDYNAPRAETLCKRVDFDQGSCGHVESTQPRIWHDHTSKRMVLIPPGEFIMGSDRGLSDERPPHKVRITRAFYMDETAVTAGDWAKCVQAGVCQWPLREKPWWQDKRPGRTQEQRNLLKYCSGGGPRVPDHPMVCVNFWETRDYCVKWRKARLPTEAEWEWAARGGQKGPLVYPWGNELTKKKALWGVTTGTTKVRSYPPNGYGLYDMAGNVWEWVNDWYDRKYYAQSPVDDPKGPCDGRDGCPRYRHRSMRGGSWVTMPGAMRLAYRNHHRQHNRFLVVGFRCAASVPGPRLQAVSSAK